MSVIGTKDGLRQRATDGIEEKEILETTTTRNSSGNTEMCIKPANKNNRNHKEKVTKWERDKGRKNEKLYIQRINLKQS